LSQLPASADEARYVAGELGGRTEFHLGAADLKAALLDPSARAPILHVATHAVADEFALERSRILFSSAGGSTDADYLFLKEAYDLPLSNVELAVLSACDTERGAAVRGEGVQSFSRAFLAAGARSTVTTLWRVADRPTADFMRVFYHHLQRGVPRDEALRLAKSKLLDSGAEVADPHFWASFVMTGDALQSIPGPVAWTTLGALLLGIAAATTVAIRFASSRRKDARGAS
jgi:CHAT domain-containing protein